MNVGKGNHLLNMDVNTKSRKSTLIRSIAISFLFSVIGILLLEGFARIIYREPKWVNQNYVEISKDFPELDTLIEDAQNTYAHPKYYEEFIYSTAPISTTHINFTNYFSARLTPDSVPLNEAEHIVWTFGGSTMENTETTDELTIANTWTKIFNEKLGPTHVKNFGTGGFFSSYELIKFQKILREVPESELPTIAIFYDGYNDAFFGFQYGAGNMQTDLSLKLQALVEHKNLVMWIYTSSRGLSKYSRLWEQSGSRMVEYLLFPLAEPNTDEPTLDTTIRVYVSNIKMIQAICDVYHIKCYFILQPLIITKHPLTELEQGVLNGMEGHPRFGPKGIQFIRNFYYRVKNELVNNQQFIDASHVLDGRSQPDFYDLGHTSALTSPIIGEKIAELILSRITLDLYQVK
jgi:hypothetical protein